MRRWVIAFRAVRIVAATFSMYLVTHAFVFAILPLVILISYVAKEKMPAAKALFVRGLFAIVGKELKVSGRSNLDPARGYLIVSNYPSFYAGFALMGAFPEASVVAHAFLKKVPLLSRALNRAGAIFVRPGAAGQGGKAIDHDLSERGIGRGVIIFPEGERTPDGRIHDFKRGFVRILRQTSLDLLPVTLNGLYRLKPVWRFYADPDAEPELVVHPPVSNATAREMRDEDLLTGVRGVIGSAYRP